nr:MAG TPA: hypothetical protein [Caudoviricetes sp.]
MMKILKRILNLFFRETSNKDDMIALEWKLRRRNHDENIKKNSEFIF